ncbi:Vacuolar protein sorting-associated protein 27 [Diplonema papillatum]|nr:Vacuolar protein sorting-associated protein 27 [Diplonema papillatum]
MSDAGAVPWQDAEACLACQKTFGLTVRKHHCRACGGVFCKACSAKKIDLPNAKEEGPSRVCDACHAAELEKRKEIVIPEGPTLLQPTETAADLSDADEPALLAAPAENLGLIHQPLCLDLYAESLTAQNPSFDDFIGDHAINAAVPVLDQGVDTPNLFSASSTLSRLQHTLKYMAAGLTASNQPDIAACSAMLSGAQEYTEILLRMPSPPMDKDGASKDEAKVARYKQRKNLVIFEALRSLQSRFKAAEADGGCVLVPVLWTRERATAANPDDDGGACLFVLERQRDEFKLGIVNMSDGLDLYHPVCVDSSTVSAGRYLRVMPCVYPNTVKREAAVSSWVWYLSLYQLLNPSQENGPRFVYEVIAPALTRCPPRMRELARGEGAWWQAPPEGKDRSFALSVLACVRWVFALKGQAGGQSADAEIFVRVAVLRAVCNEGKFATPSEINAVRLACTATSRAAAKSDSLGKEVNEEVLSIIRRLNDALSNCTPGTAAALAAQSSPPVVSESFATRPDEEHSLQHHHWALLDRRRRDENSLAGKPVDPKILLPINTVDIKDEVSSPADCVLVFKEAIDAVGLYAAQHELIPNHAHLSFMLMQHIVCRVMRLPSSDASTCFWAAAADFRYETQQTLLQQLAAFAKSFAAVSLSLKSDRELDGARVIVSSAIMTLTDAIARAQVVDSPSFFSQHYAGRVRCCKASAYLAPVEPYGLYFKDFVRETESVLLFSPELVNARTQVLDYWAALNVPRSNVLFALKDMAISDAEAGFVTQLSLASGRGNKNVNICAALTGKDPWLTDMCPEIVILRDVCFLTGMMLCAFEDMLPPQSPYRASDAKLYWGYTPAEIDPATKQPAKGERDRLTVKGFRNFDLGPCKAQPPKAENPSGWRKLLEALPPFSKKKPRNISHASPGVLLDDEAVSTEDDVLYVHKLPTFGGTLSASACEMLLSFLTAPNLRIPLLLTFFATHERIQSLADVSLQKVVTSAIFEPGPWQPDADLPIPDTIPAKTRDHLRTPCGLLFDELCKSPEPVLKACLQLISVAQEKCTGRYNSASSEIILFTVRLVTRVNRYLHFLVEALDKQKTGVDMNVARGLQYECLAPTVKRKGLVRLMQQIDRELERGVFIRLDDWAKQAEKLGTSAAACRIHAHLALLHQNCSRSDFCKPKPDAARNSPAACMLSSQVYLAMYHDWGGAGLGVSETEVCDIFEKVRRRLYRALTDSPGVRDEALEAVKTAVAGSETKDCSWEASVAIPGAFFDGARTAVDEKHMRPTEGETYLAWLQRTASATDTLCVNLNNGLFSHTRDDITRIPAEVQQNIDFKAFFGEGRMRCALLSEHAHRTAVRLLGTTQGTLDIHYWSEDPKAMANALDSIGWHSGLPAWRSARHAWVSERVLSDAAVGGLVELVRMDLRVLEETDKHASLAGVLDGAVFNVVLFTDPPVTHVHQMVECGRRVFRVQRFTTDAVWSYHSPHKAHAGEERSWTTSRAMQSYYRCGKEWTLSAGAQADRTPFAESVQIIRSAGDRVAAKADSLDQTAPGGQNKQALHLPARLLLGILPDALLEQFTFWQDYSSRQEDVGDPGLVFGESIDPSDKSRVAVRIGTGKRAAKTAIARTHRTIDDQEVTWWLMNLLDADSPTARELAAIFTRLENLSHVLVWCCTSSDVEGGKQTTVHVKRIELPRLRLTFTQQGAKLTCDQHGGYYLKTTPTDAATARQADLFGGGFVLLEKDTGELAVLASAVAEPLRPAAIALSPETPVSWVDRRLPTQLLFRRSEPSLVADLSTGVRHHFYPVHHSHKFLKTTSMTSMMYLMVCLALRRRYVDVAEMGHRLGEVKAAEEYSLFKFLINALMDDRDVPDAVACRLRLSLSIAAHCAVDAFSKVNKNWDAAADALRYFKKRSDISAALALSLSDEIHVLDTVLRSTNANAAAPAGAEAAHRQLLLEARNRSEALLAVQARQGTITAEYLKIDTDEEWKQRNYYDCGSPVLTSADWIAPCLKAAVYTRQQRLDDGVTTVAYMNEILDRDRRLNVLLIYEIYVGSFRPHILGSDSERVLAGLLTRLLVYRDPHTLGSQFLRAMEAFPDHVADLPPLPSAEDVARRKEEAKSKGFSLFSSSTVATQASLFVDTITEACSRLRKQTAAARNGKEYESFHDKYEQYLPDRTVRGLDAVAPWAAVEYAPAVRITSEDVTSVYDDIKAPLRRILDDFVVSEGEDVDSNSLTTFAGVLEQCGGGAAEEPAAAPYATTLNSIRKRMDERKRVAAMRSVEAPLLRDLEQRLTRLLDEDAAVAEDLEAKILAAFNPAHDEVRRVAQSVPTHDMPSVCRLYLDRKGDATPPADPRVFEKVTAWLVRQSRVGLVKQALLALRNLRGLLEFGQASDLEVKAAGRALARLLSSERFHVGSSPANREVKICDPRILVFEYLGNLILRRGQVQLLADLMKAYRAKTSSVRQMIMGEGKTTVVTPMMALFCANGTNVVAVCLPRALVALSKTVLLDAFSSPVLPRPVLTLDFHRSSSITDALCQRITATTTARGVLVMHPTAVKSLLLKFVLCFERLDEDTRLVADAKVQEKNAGTLARFVDRVVGGASAAGISGQEKVRIRDELTNGEFLLNKLRQNAIMLMDEVDVLLHPLKSELNWPLGARLPIDLTKSADANDPYNGIRYKLPWFLLEIVFALSGDVTKPHELSAQPLAAQPCRDLHAAFAEGKRTHKLHGIPHLILLDKSYYHATLRPLIGKLVTIRLQACIHSIDPDDIEAFLTAGKSDVRCSDKEAKLLNLAHDWLAHFLPHVLAKVHRVGFGVLREDELRAFLKADPTMPKSRQLLAIPFVGKDTPSDTSEFQHPDVTIGFTIHSYFQDGLRPSDLKTLIRLLQADYDQDGHMPAQTRTSALTYVKWMLKENACVKGYSWSGEYLFRKEEDKTEPRQVDYAETPAEEFIRKEMWQLPHLNAKDEHQLAVVARFLTRSPLAAKHLLFEHAFPRTLLKAARQLSASGQELSSSLLSGYRFGFSGTPNDIMPEAMGKCHFSETDDGEMIKTLIDPAVVSVTSVASRDPSYLLQHVSESKASALIDTGALITGFTNFEVARKLLELDIPFKGVVFLDQSDRRVVLLKNGRTAPLEQCGLSVKERFTFYDHVHTTGMDIAQALEAAACLTLSQDMVFRDYVQGAYRMRGIGKGQTLRVLATPEILTIVRNTLRARFPHYEPRPERRQFDVLLWLLRNGFEAERAQRGLMAEQSVKFLFKNRAFADLSGGATPAAVVKAVQILREPVQADLQNFIEPTAAPAVALRNRDKLKHHVAMMEEHIGQTLTPDEKRRVDALLQASSTAKFVVAAAGLEGHIQNEAEAEAQQEEEAEREAQEEIEQEEEQQMEYEQEVHAEAATEQEYDRRKLPVDYWKIEELARDPDASGHFKPLSSFVPNSKTKAPAMPFPPFILASKNYVDKPFLNLRPLKRQKNVLVYLEWLPDPADSTVLQSTIPLAPQQEEQLTAAFEQFSDETGEKRLAKDRARDLLDQMDLGFSDEVKDTVLARGTSYEALKDSISSMALYHLAAKRYMVVITLEECEHLRMLLATDAVANYALAIHACHMKNCLGHTELQVTAGYQKAMSTRANVAHHVEATEACLAFFDCSELAGHREMLWVLRLLRDRTPEERKRFWLANRALKRRKQASWQNLPILLQTVMTEEAEYGVLQAKQLLHSIQAAALQKNIPPEALFYRFDVRRRGQLSRDELEAGIAWLGVGKNQNPFAWKNAVTCLFKLLAGTADPKAGVTRDMLRRHLSLSDEDEQAFIREIAQNDAPFPAGGGPARVEQPKEELLEAPPKLTAKGRFSITTVVPHFRELWNSVDVGCDSVLSVWKARLGDRKGKTRRVRFGDYIRPGLEAPEHKESVRLPLPNKPSFEIPAKMWEITDTVRSLVYEGVDFDKFLRTHFPHPVDYHNVWTLRSPTKPLYIWAPVPPKGPYARGGLVATTTETPPPCDYVRCLPETFLLGEDARVTVWKDASQGNPMEISVDRQLGLFDVEMVSDKIVFTSTLVDLASAAAQQQKQVKKYATKLTGTGVFHRAG